MYWKILSSLSGRHLGLGHRAYIALPELLLDQGEIVGTFLWAKPGDEC